MSEKFDADLLDASKEAMTTGCIMPLLKKELWLKIQSRRLKEGKEELVVPPTLPLSHQISQAEKVKKLRRQDQNKKAAKRFRQKEKIKHQDLLSRIESLEENNCYLEIDKAELVRQKDCLLSQLNLHLSECPGLLMHVVANAFADEPTAVLPLTALTTLEITEKERETMKSFDLQFMLDGRIMPPSSDSPPSSLSLEGRGGKNDVIELVSESNSDEQSTIVTKDAVAANTKVTAIEQRKVISPLTALANRLQIQTACSDPETACLYPGVASLDPEIACLDSSTASRIQHTSHDLSAPLLSFKAVSSVACSAQDLTTTANKVRDGAAINDFTTTANKVRDGAAINDLTTTVKIIRDGAMINDLTTTANKVRDGAAINDLTTTANKVRDGATINDLTTTAKKVRDGAAINDLTTTAQNVRNGAVINDLTTTVKKVCDGAMINDLTTTANKVRDGATINILTTTASKVHDGAAINDLTTTANKVRDGAAINDLITTANKVRDGAAINDLTTTANKAPDGAAINDSAGHSSLTRQMEQIPLLDESGCRKPIYTNEPKSLVDTDKCSSAAYLSTVDLGLASYRRAVVSAGGMGTKTERLAAVGENREYSKDISQMGVSKRIILACPTCSSVTSSIVPSDFGGTNGFTLSGLQDKNGFNCGKLFYRIINGELLQQETNGESPVPDHISLPHASTPPPTDLNSGVRHSHKSNAAKTISNNDLTADRVSDKESAMEPVISKFGMPESIRGQEDYSKLNTNFVQQTQTHQKRDRSSTAHQPRGFLQGSSASKAVPDEDSNRLVPNAGMVKCVLPVGAAIFSSNKDHQCSRNTVGERTLEMKTNKIKRRRATDDWHLDGATLNDRHKRKSFTVSSLMPEKRRRNHEASSRNSRTIHQDLPTVKSSDLEPEQPELHKSDQPLHYPGSVTRSLERETIYSVTSGQTETRGKTANYDDDFQNFLSSCFESMKSTNDAYPEPSHVVTSLELCVVTSGLDGFGKDLQSSGGQLDNLLLLQVLQEDLPVVEESTEGELSSPPASYPIFLLSGIKLVSDADDFFHGMPHP